MLNNKIIINVGRQLGSGGHDIARMLAMDFNAKYYDKELLNLAAKESGFCENSSNRMMNNVDFCEHSFICMHLTWGIITCTATTFRKRISSNFKAML